MMILQQSQPPSREFLAFMHGLWKQCREYEAYRKRFRSDHPCGEPLDLATWHDATCRYRELVREAAGKTFWPPEGAEIYQLEEALCL